MSLFSFYREPTPYPPTAAKDDADYFQYHPGVPLTFFGTPGHRIHFEEDSDDETEVEVLELSDEKLQLHQETRLSDATTLCPTTVGNMAMPVELWEIIFSFVCPDADDDSFQSLSDLLSCALTCRVWSLIALPMLYRTHGYGVFMPKPAAGRNADYFPASRCIDFFTGTANCAMMKLWRTLLLSCFTASRPTSTSRFATFAGATLFPYITYVQNLDARSLVMVLSAIMKSQTCDTKRRSTLLEVGSGEYFFGGALGALEISGEVRSERMIVGGPEYQMRSPVGGKEVKIFVGDTALIMMDFLYPHLHHLKGFTIPELGQLRVHPPITMSHPVDLLTSMHALNSLVISSGWMVSAGLGKAIASIRPSLNEPRKPSSPFNITILDWRFRTHYDPHYHSDETWENTREVYRYTVRSASDFFNALNPNSITSLDLDFEVRYHHPSQGDLGEGTIVIGQASSLSSLRISHLPCSDRKLISMLTRMGNAGFSPKALRLEDLYNESEGLPNRETTWGFAPKLLENLEYLELSRFSGMFDLVAGIIRTREEEITCLKTLTLCYTDKHLREAPIEDFLITLLPSLSHTLTSLKIVDTDHGLVSTVAPRRRARYDIIYGHNESPLEQLSNLHTLTLTGDICAFLIGNRLPYIINALQHTLLRVDLCFPTLAVADLTLFTACRELESLVLREWNWDLGLYGRKGKLTVDEVKGFWKRCRTVGGKFVLKDLGIAGGLLEVAGERSWGELREWGRRRSGRWRWEVGEMKRAG